MCIRPKLQRKNVSVLYKYSLKTFIMKMICNSSEIRCLFLCNISELQNGFSGSTLL